MLSGIESTGQIRDLRGVVASGFIKLRVQLRDLGRKTVLGGRQFCCQFGHLVGGAMLRVVELRRQVADLRGGTMLGNGQFCR